MKRGLKKGAALICALFCTLIISMPSMAYRAIDTGRKTSLTLSYGRGGKIISNASFDLFRVADVSENRRYTLSGEFSKYRVNLNDLDSEGWRGAAETLSAYARRDKCTPVKSGRTDEKGQLFFDGLDAGLYMTAGETTEIGTWRYTPEPMLILLPGIDENDQWIYDLTVSPKYEEVHKPGGDEGGDKTTDRKVLKVWRGNEGVGRPSEIVVQLLQNGDIYDTVTLNAENDWRHTWEDLDKEDTWQVTEYEVPEHYTVSVSREGITFVVTNTYQPETLNPDSPGSDGSSSDDPGGSGGRSVLDPNGVPLAIMDSEVPAAGFKLPQTGMLWWPVPLLASAGLLLVVIGLCIRRRKDGHDEP